jgi:chemotaxis protein MotB
MALGSRRSRRPSIDIWPGFVDALAQLLMVIIFVLLVFTAGQFLLSDALSGRDKALQQLQLQLNELSDLLALEKRSSAELRSGTASLTAQLQAAIAERDALTTRVAELAAKAEQEVARADQATGKLRDAETVVAADKEKVELQLRQIESLRRDIEALKTVRADLEAKVASLAAGQQQSTQEAGALRDRSKELEARLASEQERTALAQKDISDRDIRLRALGERADKAETALAAEQQTSRAARAEVEQLSGQIAALREQLAKIAAALDASEAKAKEQQGQIVDLGRRLNLALASKVQELARYRSEFFGRLREIIGDRADIRIVGDRFVFQSEVLFTPGSAELGEPAKAQLDPVIAALKAISQKIPPDINWVLRVDGHTDRRPISNAQFASNWELSAARAISVVRYAVAQGVPPARLAAAGFADNQPLEPGDNDEAYRRNRRIELKLTER